MTAQEMHEDDREGHRMPQEPEFEEISGNGLPTEHLSIEDLRDVHLTVTAELGKCKMLIREILELKRGSVIQLDKLAGEMTDVFVNGLLFARGEVIVIADTLHIRIGEIVGSEDTSSEITQE